MPPKLEEGSDTERLQLVVPSSLMQRVDEWRRKQPRIPTKSEAIRMLLERGLEPLVESSRPTTGRGRK